MKSSRQGAAARSAAAATPSTENTAKAARGRAARAGTGTADAPRQSRRGRPRKTQRKESAQDRILDAAEELLARHGFYGVTIRQVAQHAGVDTALLHYYYGSKRGLFDAVFGRRAQILNQLRMESLDRYESEAGDNMTIEGVTDAFIRPLIDMATEGGPGWRNYFALVAQVNNAPVWGGATMTRYFDPVIHRFIGLLRKLLPDTPPEDIYWCFQQLTGAITLTLSQTGRIDRLSGGLCRSSDLRAAYARMVPYAAGGLRAVCEAAANRAKASAPRRSSSK